MFESLINFLRDGCAHRRVTWPIKRTGTTIARQSCLDCGMYRLNDLHTRTRWYDDGPFVKKAVHQ